MTVDRIEYVVDHLPNGDAVVLKVTQEIVANFGHGDGSGESGYSGTESALAERDRLRAGREWDLAHPSGAGNEGSRP